MTEHAKNVQLLNWSWAIFLIPFPHWHKSVQKEILSDFDNICINTALAEAASEPNPDSFLHLEHFVIDL